MSTREIHRDEWVAFFDGFNRQHSGWLVSIEVFGADMGAQIEASELPLQGVVAETHEAGREAISIMAGEEPAEHMTHRIDAPTHVRLLATGEGADAALEIESADGVRTLVRFRVAVPSDALDGVA
jgi:hypothetical protein